MPEISDVSPVEVVKPSRNWDRILERAAWGVTAVQVLMAAAWIIWSSEPEKAASILVGIPFLVLVALSQRDRAKLADHAFTLRGYAGARLVSTEHFTRDEARELTDKIGGGE